jgi:UDP-N-acetylglucosamine--N-acetylmuramyl-(pentapeptide) pyrophosphoryl-undecaprenol N-acetylglucosamine transferase
MPESKTILFAGGGTGGHLYPGIAVAEALRESHPHITPVFMCTQREIDRTILAPTGFEFIPQPIVPPVTTITGLLKFWKAWRETKDLVRKTIRERKPVAVLGLGGYAAGVGVKIASLKKIPTAIVNPDVVPGKANKYLMQYSTAVCCQFAETAEHVSPNQKSKLKTTGCPIRKAITDLPPRDEAAKRLDLDPTLKTLLVTGASLGAKTVNEAAVALLPQLELNGWQVLHLSGKDHANLVRAGYREKDFPAHVVDFTPAMADVWSVADLAISRSGASSCAELTACGVPSLLMPYPYHKDLHQRANAKVLENGGAAILVDDEKDATKNAAKLKPILESLLYDATKQTAMSEAATRLGRPDAARAVADVLVSMI